MRRMNMLQTTWTVLIALALACAASAQTPSADKKDLPGTEEFGMSKKELIQSTEKVEQLIAQCMSEQGFEYVAADWATVRNGMTADKSMPGMTEKEFVSQYGFGVATLYTGLAPQLNGGYSPAKLGLGDRNVQVYKNLSAADQVAYNRVLLGENTDATFAVALESENLSRCGGCTLKAIEQVFKPEQLKSTYINPLDALIRKDPRMKEALRKFAEEMHKAGFEYNHPDEVESDIRNRLYAITGGGTIPVEKMSSDQAAALKKLQDDERRSAVINLKLQDEIFDPIEEKIEKEMYARQVQ
jgi:hypothetical protein